jgi:arylsulfatase A-like enzyme/Tfp pilus assembly protein PilF
MKIRAIVGLSVAVLLMLGFGCRRRVGGEQRTRPNVLLITIDTVRADHLGAYGNLRAQTPNLDSLAASGLRFDQAVSAVPLTLPSHATILSGLLPPHHGLRDNGAGKFPANRETLATRFSSSGYRTGAFIGSFVLDHRFGLNRGFDTYDDEVDRDPASPAALEAERPGVAVVGRALEWLAKEDGRPFFAWVHLYDAHAPYNPPEPFASRFRDNLYDGEIASVDFQIGRLLSWLREKGSFDNTLVVVAADHGEALGEHGELTHGFLLYQATIRVPLLMRWPGSLPAGRTISTPVSLADLAPTVCGLAQSALSPAGGVDGRDLSETIRKGGEPAAADLYSESEYPRVFGWSGTSALRRKNLKYILAPQSELYDLSRDPHESANLLEKGAARSDLSARIAEFRRGERKSETAAPLNSEAAAKLASLGYINGRMAESSDALKDPKEMVHAYREFEDAHREILTGKLEDAIGRMTRLVEADSKNSVFLDSLAQAYRKKGDLGRAIEFYRRSVAASPQDADGRYNLAVTLQEAGRSREALAAIKETLARDAQRPEAINVLGIALFTEGKTAEALSEFDRAAALDSRDPQTQNNRGNALKELGRFEEAQAAYRRAIAVAPRYGEPWNGLGVLLTGRGRAAEAISAFDRALALAPEFHEARLNRGIALETAGDRPAAAAAYRDFLEKSSGDPSFMRQRRIAQQLLNRISAAPQPWNSSRIPR